VSVTVAVCAIPPEVAETIIGYVPAGVPVAGLTGGREDGPVPTAPQATRPAVATISNANSSCGARRCTRTPEARSESPARANAMPAKQTNGKTGRDVRGKKVVETAVCGIVAIDSVTV
jgi:hypothetical protein